ncbi:MAG: tail sheath stabilizer and completion protein [Nitrososphaeraceae archaeon]
MAIQHNGYWYKAQIVCYINQFMSIFEGLQVQIGKRNTDEEQLIPVNIRYGHMDKVVAALMAENTQNKPIKLPAMSAYMSGFKLAMDRAAGVGTERRNTYVEVGGLVPDDMKVIHQRKPLPYDLSMDLYIFASNTNQHLQILEQILPLFDPSLNIQISDAPFDWTRLTHVELTDIILDTNYPIGVDRRIVHSTLKFTMPIWLDIPAVVRRDFIERIYLRIGTVSTNATDSYEIVAELDGQNLPYELVATTDDLPFE